MYYPNVPSIIETDDLEVLRSMSIQTYDTGQEITMTFTLNPRKYYLPGQVPERVLLTDGVAPRFLYPSPRVDPVPSFTAGEYIHPLTVGEEAIPLTFDPSTSTTYTIVEEHGTIEYTTYPLTVDRLGSTETLEVVSTATDETGTITDRTYRKIK